MINNNQISKLLRQVKQLDIIREGLDLSYSPNHKGQTTTEHLGKQFEMADTLSRVASLMNGNTPSHETINDVKSIEMLLDQDYDSLQNMIANEGVKDKDSLYVTKTDLRDYFEPLLKDLNMSDLKVLIAVAATHDFGKVNPVWAKDRLNLTGVEFIAHDYDSRTILENNPELLSMFDFKKDEFALVLDLVKLHSLPGQYFFGEGNLSGYQPVFDYARAMSSESPMKLARIHGFIDVMSALNKNFVKPILNSHMNMSSLITNVYQGSNTLGQAFYNVAVAATGEMSGIMDKFGFAPNTMYRLMKLTGFKADDKDIIYDALSRTDISYLSEFNKATAGEATWYGTYIANAFGSGLKRAFRDDITEEQKGDVVKATIRAIAVASDFHNKFGDSSYALSSVTPGLMVDKGNTQEILSELMSSEKLNQMSKSLQAQGKGLYIRGNNNAVEIGYATE